MSQFQGRYRVLVGYHSNFPMAPRLIVCERKLLAAELDHADLDVNDSDLRVDDADYKQAPPKRCFQNGKEL